VLPDELLKLIVEKYNVSKKDANLLTRNKSVAKFFTECATYTTNYKKLAKWIINNLLLLLKNNSLSIESAKIKPKDFASLVNMIVKSDITDRIGKTLLTEMIISGKSPEIIIEEKGIVTVEDEKQLNKFVDNAFNSHPNIIEQLRAGETKAINVLIGDVMLASKGNADAKRLKKIISQRVKNPDK